MSAGVPKRASAPPHESKEVFQVSRIISSLKDRRIEARNNRAIARLIDRAGSPAMRDELIIMAQRSHGGITR